MNAVIIGAPVEQHTSKQRRTVVMEKTATKTFESTRRREEAPSTVQPAEASMLSLLESAAQEGFMASKVMTLTLAHTAGRGRLDDAGLGDRLMVSNLVGTLGLVPVRAATTLRKARR